VSRPEARAALGGRKPVRPHPAAPAAVPAIDRVQGPAAQEEAGLVMFCVRVAPSLRRRVKLAAIGSGRTIQELTVEALDAACARLEG
jgi:hypothetical protein